MTVGLAETAVGDDDWENSVEGLEEEHHQTLDVDEVERFANQDVDTDTAKKTGGIALSHLELTKVPDGNRLHRELRRRPHLVTFGGRAAIFRQTPQPLGPKNDETGRLYRLL